MDKQDETFARFHSNLWISW